MLIRGLHAPICDHRTRICSRRRTSEAARGSAQVDDCSLYNLGTAAVSSTEAVEEAGENDTALPLGRANECDTSTVDNVEDSPRRLDRHGGLRVTVPRARNRKGLVA